MTDHQEVPVNYVEDNVQNRLAVMAMVIGDLSELLDLKAPKALSNEPNKQMVARIKLGKDLASQEMNSCGRAAGICNKIAGLCADVEAISDLLKLTLDISELGRESHDHRLTDDQIDNIGAGYGAVMEALYAWEEIVAEAFKLQRVGDVLRQAREAAAEAPDPNLN